MGEVPRASWCFLALVLVSSKGIYGKPFFGSIWCDMFCIEYEDGVDDSVSTTTTLEQLMDSFWDPCSDCPVLPSRVRTTTPNPRNFLPWSLMFPPSMVGMNITNLNGGPPGGGWIVQPWNGQPGQFPGPFPGPFPGGPPAMATPAASAPAASPAPPAASTAAPPAAAAATTTASGATTAAPATTAAAG